ncbi:MAG TPA: hypothetical protein DF383_05145 [Deltaproteobacteria bacterium]|nr:hypothetical protein [Deltaproteobacteria bacterium]
MSLTIPPDDERRLESLKKTLGARSKVEVLRRALDSLEENIVREKQIQRWRQATLLAAPQSAKINREFHRARF